MGDSPDVLIARAAVHYSAGEYDAAARWAMQIVAQEPDHFDALHLLGVLCLDRKRLADAVGYLERAARSRPNEPRLNVNRANAFLALDQLPRSEGLARQVLAAHPGDLDALNTLAIALVKQERTAEAMATFRTALTYKPDHPASLFNMGKVLESGGRLGEAEAAYRSALPNASADRIMDILGNLGGVLTALGRPAEVLDLFRNTQAGRTDPLDLEWFESLLHLQLGDYESGWRAYESRWRIAGHDKPHPGARLLDIATIAGKRVLCAGEQGRGDIIQFARYAALLAERGAIVYMRAYDDLKTLLSTVPGVAGVVGEDELDPACDSVTQLLSLPLVFGTTIATIPADVPYLSADPKQIAVWRERLGCEPVRHVGLAWSSTNAGPARMMKLAALAPLLGAPRTCFHSLQKEMNSEDLAFLRTNGRVHDHRAALVDFAETAALIEALDLVVTIDTSVAHLAGALGKPVWIMLPHIAEWRWLRHRLDSPWYPTARLYRQPAPGAWGEVIDQIVTALDHYSTA